MKKNILILDMIIIKKIVVWSELSSFNIPKALKDYFQISENYTVLKNVFFFCPKKSVLARRISENMMHLTQKYQNCLLAKDCEDEESQ